MLRAGRHLETTTHDRAQYRPDHIVVGEVRGGTAADLLQALNTGHVADDRTKPTTPLKTAGSFSRFGQLQSPGQDLPNEIIQFPTLLTGRRAR